MDDFIYGYVNASDDPIDINQAILDCERFVELAGDIIQAGEKWFQGIMNPGDSSFMLHIGHNFRLTRDHHACGKVGWDWPSKIRQELFEVARQFD